MDTNIGGEQRVSSKNDLVRELNIIGAGTVFEGKLKTQGSIRIDGKMTGELSSAENVAIGPMGEIEGTVTAKNVTIGGKIRGTVTASEKLVFEGKAVVRADIRSSKLVIDEGAVFDGKCMMTDSRPSHT